MGRKAKSPAGAHHDAELMKELFCRNAPSQHPERYRGWGYASVMQDSPGMQQRRQVDLRAAQNDRLHWPRVGGASACSPARELAPQQCHNQRRATQRCRQRTIGHYLHIATLHRFIRSKNCVKQEVVKHQT